MENINTARYQVLIVEDMFKWSRKMEHVLISTLNIPKSQVDVADSIDDARQKLDTKHYHFISMDMRMPEYATGSVKVSVGSNFTIALKKNYPCLGVGIYTAYAKDRDNGLPIGMVAGQDIPVWQKSAGSGDLTGISVEQWAINIKEWLDQKQLKFSFNQAANHLPCHLAETAGLINRRIDSKDKKDAAEFMQQTIHFWTLTLRLATVQAMAIAHSAHIHFNVPENSTYEALEKTLSDILSALNVKNSNAIALWMPYLGMSATNDNANLHSPFLDSSKKIRLLRNEFSHQTPLVDCREQVEKLMPDLKIIMDAAVFWANFPLLTEVRPNGHNRYSAQVIKGSGYPWEEKTFQISMNQGDTEPNPDHIYLNYSSPYSDTTELIDLWPFVKKEAVSGMDRPCLYLFSHHWKNQWYRMSMMNGKAKVWKPSNEEIQILK